MALLTDQGKLMGNAFGWPHLLIILAVVLLLFGATKLPALAKSLGQSARVFKGEMKAMKSEDAATPSTSDSVVPESATPLEPTKAASGDGSPPSPS